MEQERIQLILEAVDKARALFDQAQTDLRKFTQQQNVASRSSNAMEAAMGRVRRMASGLGSVFTQLGSVFRATFGRLTALVAPMLALLSAYKAFGAVKAMTGLAGDAEELQQRLTNLTGSVTTAKERTRELMMLTARSPFNLPELEKASRLFEQNAKGILTVNQGLQMASDIAVTTRQPIEQVAEAVTKLFEKIRMGREIEMESLKGVLSASDVDRLRSMSESGASVALQLDFVVQRMQRFQGATSQQQATFNGLLGTAKAWLSLLQTQFGEAIRDRLIPVVQALNNVLEQAFNSEVVRRWGETFVDVVSLVVSSAQSGRLPELISLVVGVGIEEGMRIGREAMDRGFRSLFSVTLAGMAMDYGVMFANVMLEAVRAPVDFLSAGFTWLIDKADVGFRKLANSLGQPMVAVLNFLAKTLENILNRWLERAAVVANLFGVSMGIPSVDLGRFEFQATAIPDAIKFETAYATAKMQSAEAVESVVGWLREQVAISKSVLSGNDEEVNNKQKLIALLEEEAEKRRANSKALEAARETQKVFGGDEAMTVERLAALKGGTFSQDRRYAFADRMKAFNSMSTDPSTYGQGGSFGNSMAGAFENFTASLGNNATRAAALVQGTLGNAISGLSDGIMGLIDGTKTWGQMFMDIGRSIIKSIIDIGVQFLAQQVLMRGAAMATSAAMTALGVAQQAQNSTTLASGAAAGVGTSASQGGWVGILIYLGVLAAALGAVAAMTGGFAEGGFTGPGGTYEPAGVVHRGEYVFSQADVDRIGLQNIVAFRFGRMPGSIGLPNVSGSFATGGLVGDPIAGGKTNVNIGFLDNRQDRREWARRDGVKVFLSELQRRGNKVAL